MANSRRETVDASSGAQAAAMPFQPVRFGKYFLLDKVAVGGMAEIFRAKSFGHSGFEKVVVIKRILSQFAGNEDFVEMFIDEAKIIRLGGGEKGVARQHRHGRLTARERIAKLVDPGGHVFECGLFAAWNMYQEYGGAPGAGVVTAIAPVGGRLGFRYADKPQGHL